MSKRSRGKVARAPQERAPSERRQVESGSGGLRVPKRAGGRTGRRIRPYVLPGIFLVAALAGIAAIAAAAIGAPATTNSTAIRPVLGNPAAPVLIREYGDFQCPSCGAFARSIEPQIRTTFIDTGIARLEWHDFAWIGSESRDAANAARCAGDLGAFWPFHDLLYANQGGENAGAFSRDRLKAFGDRLSLNPAAFHACVDDGTHLDAVQADFADVRANGFNGTPTFLIGSQRIVGAQPFEVFAAAINAVAGR